MVARRGVLEVVGGDDDGAAGGPLLGQHGADLLHRRDVEPGRRLVEQQQVGLLGEALGDERPLALAARQLAQVAAGERAELDAVDGVAHGVAVGGRIRPTSPRIGARPRATTSRTVTGRLAGVCWACRT